MPAGSFNPNPNPNPNRNPNPNPNPNPASKAPVVRVHQHRNLTLPDLDYFTELDVQARGKRRLSKVGSHSSTLGLVTAHLAE